MHVIVAIVWFVIKSYICVRCLGWHIPTVLVQAWVNTEWQGFLSTSSTNHKVSRIIYSPSFGAETRKRDYAMPHHVTSVFRDSLGEATHIGARIRFFGGEVDT